MQGRADVVATMYHTPFVCFRLLPARVLVQLKGDVNTPGLTVNRNPSTHSSEAESSLLKRMIADGEVIAMTEYTTCRIQLIGSLFVAFHPQFWGFAIQAVVDHALKTRNVELVSFTSAVSQGLGAGLSSLSHQPTIHVYIILLESNILSTQSVYVILCLFISSFGPKKTCRLK